MDDLFQYLIYAIIIISFLSSFFKKKEPPKQTPLPKAKQPQNTASVKQQEVSDEFSVSQKKDEYDILRELENLFKGEVNIPQQPQPKPPVLEDVYKSREIKDTNLDSRDDTRFSRDVQDKSPLGYRATYDQTIADRKIASGRPSQQVDAKIEASAKEFEKVLAGPRKQRAAITEFNRKLKNPRSVREYILFSEILGKPKALRR
jgi:hypothetical protein